MSESHDNDYIDPKFEHPWIQSGASLEENIQLEQAEIAKVKKVIKNFVAEMARRRKTWKDEYDRLQQEFGNMTHTPTIITPIRRKRYRRYRNLQRIFGDLPERETYATRDVHRKTHGCLAGTFNVSADLEPDLAKGLFQPGATYDAVIRFSSGKPSPGRSPPGRPGDGGQTEMVWLTGRAPLDICLLVTADALEMILEMP